MAKPAIGCYEIPSCTLVLGRTKPSLAESQTPPPHWCATFPRYIYDAPMGRLTVEFFRARSTPTEGLTVACTDFGNGIRDRNLGKPNALYIFRQGLQSLLDSVSQKRRSDRPFENGEAACCNLKCTVSREWSRQGNKSSILLSSCQSTET